jgi:DNA-binding XRE family transcriptional regulator
MLQGRWKYFKNNLGYLVSSWGEYLKTGRIHKMKYELGHCLLEQRLHESVMTLNQLAQKLHYKPERIADFADNKRVMPLKMALSIAATIGCDVEQLYELTPIVE